MRERVAVLREQGRFFWLDVSLSETSRDDLVDALRIPRARPSGSGSFRRCLRITVVPHRRRVRRLRAPLLPESETPTDEPRSARPLELCVVTGNYLLTLHEGAVSLPAVLAPDLPEERSKRYVVYAVLRGDARDHLRGAGRGRAEAGCCRHGVDRGAARTYRETLRAAGSRLATMRRWVSAEQAVFARIGVEIGALRGFETQDEPLATTVCTSKVNRLLASVDAAANGLAMLLDLQLNERAYVVSVVATIFVPLTLITGSSA